MLDSYDDPAPINLGTGQDVTIRELATTIASVVGFDGTITFDPSRPDGTPRKLLDVSRLTGLGFAPAIPLRDGIRATYDWWRESAAPAAALR